MTFRLDEAGINTVLNGPKVLGILTKEAQAVATTAAKLTPRSVRLPNGRKRHVADMWRAGRAKRDGITPSSTVFSHHFAAGWVERGSVNNPPYAPLRRAVLARGHRIVENP